MTKFEIIRTDLNDKIVVKATEFRDEAAALGEYMSMLMLAGAIKMNRAGEAVDSLGGGKYRLSNGWSIAIRTARSVTSHPNRGWL